MTESNQPNPSPSPPPPAQVSKTSISLRVFAGLLLGVLGYLVQRQYLPFAINGLSKHPPIAELTEQINPTQVQSPGNPAWIALEGRETLFRQQFIKTSANGKAELTLFDGTHLILSENTLIQLEKIPEDDSLKYQKILIRLFKGSVHKEEPRKTPLLSKKIAEYVPDLELVTVNSSIQVPLNAEFSLTAEPKRTRIQIQTGEVKVMTPRGEIEIKKGEVVRIENETTHSSASSKKLPYILLTPHFDESIVSERVQPLHFVWQTAPLSIDGAPVDLETSRDPEFKTDLKSLRISSTEPPLETIEAQLKFPVPSNPTRWFWRIRSLGESKFMSETREFWILPRPAPTSPNH